jgi:hypothetical protein
VAELRSLAPLLLALGCHASVQGSAKANAGGETDAELDAEVQKERAAASSSGTKPAEPAPTANTSRPLLGARTDLSLATADVNGQCSCVRVALGDAHLGAFRWKGDAPAIDEQTQLVLALSSEGAGCTNPKGSLGASYWGYRRTGDDIVVYVENGVQGRPLAAGAIIPKPFGQGQVYLAPAQKGVIYGKAPDGKARCKLGNPGAPRTVPVTPDETGAGSAPPAPSSPDDFLTGR